MSMFTETSISYGVRGVNQIKKFQQNQIFPLYKTFNFYQFFQLLIESRKDNSKMFQSKVYSLRSSASFSLKSLRQWNLSPWLMKALSEVFPLHPQITKSQAGRLPLQEKHFVSWFLGFHHWNFFSTLESLRFLRCKFSLLIFFNSLRFHSVDSFNKIMKWIKTVL